MPWDRAIFNVFYQEEMLRTMPMKVYLLHTCPKQSVKGNTFNFWWISIYPMFPCTQLLALKFTWKARAERGIILWQFFHDNRDESKYPVRHRYSIGKAQWWLIQLSSSIYIMLSVTSTPSPIGQFFRPIRIRVLVRHALNRNVVPHSTGNYR